MRRFPMKIQTKISLSVFCIILALVTFTSLILPIQNFLTAIVAVLAIVFSYVLIWFTTRHLINPIRELTSHIVKDGEWQPIIMNTGDEIQMLADSFNAMMCDVQAEKLKLKEEKDFLGGIIQNAAAPIFVIDRNHKILFWNSALAKMTGKSSFQMTGTKQQWEPFYPTKRPVLADLVIDNNPERLDEFYKTHSLSLTRKGSIKAEGWYDNIGGQRRYIFFEATPIKNSANEVIAAVETLEDITERKLAQEEMDRQNEFLQVILDAIPSPVYYKNPQGAYIGCNKAFQTFFGLHDSSEIMGRTISEIVPAEYTAQSAMMDSTILTEQNQLNYETILPRSDGSPRNVLATKAPFFNAAGSLGGIVGTFVDITEQLQIDEQMRTMSRALEVKHSELEQLFGLVAHAKREWEETLDHLQDFVILTDADHHIRRCNKLMADFTGRTINELFGLDWRDLIAEAGFVFVAFNGISGELFHQNSGRNYDLSIYQIKDDEIITGHVVSLNDTTELRTASQKLEKAYTELKDAQLQIFQQEKMASIGQLAAGVAHEINNPMGFISSNLTTLNKYVGRLAEFIGSVDSAMQSCAGSDEAEQLQQVRKRLKIDHIMDDAHQLIAESQDGASRVRRIVQDLKSFSRVDQAESALIDINESLDTTINIAWNEIKYVAELHREFGEIPAIKCYPQQLNQVFLNLLVNSAHAMEGTQGLITVRTWSDADSLFVSVSDNGKGITEENLKRIFEPFFTTKEVGKGTGLGLSISYDIIKKHGGDIAVESQVGVGTTFTVRLPIDGPPVDETA